MTQQKQSSRLRTRPLVLIIRDGWGYNPEPELAKYDATHVASTPVDDALRAAYPTTLIETSGENVGLPIGTMGNSEVGHQNLGAGRIVDQESMRLTKEIRQGTFFENEVLLEAVARAKASGTGKLHLMGLCSDIGVHSLLGHLYGLLELAKRNGLERVYLHAFMDGRDSPPTSGRGYLAQIEAKMAEIGVGEVASVMGRFYAMDRDQRWERVRQAYRCLRVGEGARAASAAEAIESSYAKDVTDEFVEPVNIAGSDGEPVALIEDGDAVVFFNFRGDRPREITRAFVDPEFSGFDRGSQSEIYFVCMTQYDATIPAPVAFPKLPRMKNIAAQYWSELGLRQFRCAETEKYAHVTFFFNDYREEPFPGEDRQIVPSPRVRTYDLQPEMSVDPVCEAVLAHLDSEIYDVVVTNLANPDMVGHTGDLEAAKTACEAVDRAVGRIVEKVRSLGGSLLITADHGNFERMWDVENDMPHTAHTTFPVPLIMVDEELKGAKLREGGRLADVIPTMLDLMDLQKPAEMTGESLIVR